MLPVEAVLPMLLATLETHNSAVLIAPPGAGKTTGVPPALLDAPWRGDGRVIVVEPRRLAARAAAARIAELRGERAGETVGYRVRNETRASRATRVELVTAGVFVRMILEDPALDGIAAVLFDEVHERAVDLDLGLALALDAQEGLRNDLRILAMSATLDGRRFSELLRAPVVESEGRLFPVETVYLGGDSQVRIEERVARAVLKALREETGSVLAFLPGQGEIARSFSILEGKLPPGARLAPLYGAMEARAQDAAIRPAQAGERKIVLATAVAETSLTIEGVRVVVDSGLARRPRYAPGSGLTRLETSRVSRASADQRRGRAGRTEPGICYRLWDEPQTASLIPFERPEILESDLSSLAISLISWGVSDPAQLRWLDPPPAAAYAEALDLLARLGALERPTALARLRPGDGAGGGRVRRGGVRYLAALPLPPRLGHMLLEAGARGDATLAAEIAAILGEVGLGGRDVDLRHRLDGFRRDRSERARGAREAAKRWARMAGEGGMGTPVDPTDAAELLALAFPERLAQQRGSRGRFRMANGSGARLDEGDPLAETPFLAIGEVQGGGPDGRILLATPIERAAIERLFADWIVTEDRLAYDAGADLLKASRVTRLDALVLAEAAAEVPRDERAARMLAEAALARGLSALPWPDDVMALRQRLAFLKSRDPTWPDLSDEALAESREDWLLPALNGKRRLAELTPAALRDALAALLPWARMTELDRLAPKNFAAPSGRTVPIDYSSGEPVVRIAVQNLFGLAQHPAVLGGGVPILFELLSPASRPIQLTRDLPGFWRGSWRDVRADMRGRYPKHSWPEDPASAEPRAGVRR
jgi:ATP-dependent helicase HrpB